MTISRKNCSICARRLKNFEKKNRCKNFRLRSEGEKKVREENRMKNKKEKGTQNEAEE